MGIAIRVFDAIADLSGRFNPMLGRVQVLPFGAVVILQIIEGAVGLALDRDRLLERLFVRECDGGHEREHGNQAHKECQDLCEGVFHVGVLFSFRGKIIIFEHKNSFRSLLMRSEARSVWRGFYTVPRNGGTGSAIAAGFTTPSEEKMG